MKVVDCSSSKSAVTGGRRATERTKGAGIFFGREVPNLQKVGVDKTATPPISATKILWPPITDTPYPLNRLKLYWNQSFLNKISTLSVVILWLPTFYDHLFFFPIIYESPSIFGIPLLKKIPAPLGLMQWPPKPLTRWQGARAFLLPRRCLSEVISEIFCPNENCNGVEVCIR